MRSLDDGIARGDLVPMAVGWLVDCITVSAQWTMARWDAAWTRGPWQTCLRRR